MFVAQALDLASQKVVNAFFLNDLCDVYVELDRRIVDLDPPTNLGGLLSLGSRVILRSESSTGLDAATTYDICKILGEVTRMRGTIMQSLTNLSHEQTINTLIHKDKQLISGIFL